MAYIADKAKLYESFPDGLAPCPPPHPRPLDSYWTRNYKSPLEDAGSDVRLPSSVDILIIGAGLTGTTAAARLVERVLADDRDYTRQQPLRVAVLDARSFCSGATARNGGHLTALPRLQFAGIEALYGVNEALAAVELEDRAVHFVTETCKREGWVDRVDLVEGGNIHLFEDAASVAAVKHQLAAAGKAGVDVSAMRWLDKNDLLKEVGADAFAGLAIPSANLYPLKFVSALFERALRQIESSKSSPVALDLYTHTVVSSVDPVEHSPYRWKVQTSRGSVLAHTVIHATNGYASSILPSFASGPTRIVPTRGQVMAYSPWPSSNPRWTTAFSSPHSKNYYFQRLDGGPIIIGGSRVDAGKPYEFGVSDDSAVNPSVESALRSYLPEQFPKWFGTGREGDVEESWTGVMGYRVGGVPLVGQVYIDGRAIAGQYISAGYSGHGVVRAPVCGQFIADMALVELQNDVFEIPSWMPRHFLSSAEGASNKEAISEAESSSCIVV